MIEPLYAEDVVRAILDPEHPASDPLVQTVHLLMSGFGYNFYDARNVARANDPLVRAHVTGVLADAGRTLARRETEYRERFVPSATRAQPFPPSEVLQPLKRLERCARALAGVATRIATLETPATDMIWFRIREERVTLERLLAFDVTLAVNAQEIARIVGELDVNAIREQHLDEFAAAIDSLDRQLDERRALLAISP